ncbi:ankyrin repeat-containing domain protein, partial [Talaromyces proteolyticus]
PPAPVPLSFEAIDDLIYSARLGDIPSLKSDITKYSTEHNVPASSIIRSALDTEPESDGGTGACLLHWPAANGNVELLNYLLSVLGEESTELASFLNYRNYTGNTPLHWAALNTHLDCVKALVGAGADIGIKNDAGHDALFLAERADWSADDDQDDGDEEEEIEVTANGNGNVDGEKKEDEAPPTKARLVVEWLLGCEKGAGFEAPVERRDGEGGEAMEE